MDYYNSKDDYIKVLEQGLMRALDTISISRDDFDYYDELIDLTGMSNNCALDFLDRLGGDNNG